MKKKVILSLNLDFKHFFYAIIVKCTLAYWLLPFTLGVEEPMDNAGLGPAEGPSMSPHGLNNGKNDPNTEKKCFFYSLGYPSGTLTHW